MISTAGKVNHPVGWKEAKRAKRAVQNRGIRNPKGKGWRKATQAGRESQEPSCDDKLCDRKQKRACRALKARQALSGMLFR
jgi:hypothetical protein